MPHDATIRTQVEASLIRKAWSDESFKARLLKDPALEYAAELAAVGGGATLPAGVDVKAVEEGNDQLFLVLPQSPGAISASEGELTERSTRAELEGAIIRRAWQSPTFRKQLLAEPRAAYEAQIGSIRQGAKLPESVRVEILEETGDTIYLRIPQAPADSVELSEEELEQVAGGVVAAAVAIASYVVVGAVVGIAIAVENK